MQTRRRDATTTRQDILTAARSRFLDDGFARTTTRTIATDVGVDAALINRYFGTKQALWEEATRVELDLPDFDSVPRGELGRAVITAFLDRWEGDQAAALRLVLSASTTDKRAAVALKDVFAHQVRDAVARAAADHAEERTQVVVTTLLGLALCRYVLRLEGLAQQPRSAIEATYAPVLQAALAGPR